MERMKNEEKKDSNTKVDFLYGDLSSVDTKILRTGLSGYKNLPQFHDSNKNEDHAAEAISRIEGELLRRKEVLMEDIPIEEKILEETEI